MALALYDMVGNVAEWRGDNHVGPSRAVRGGNFWRAPTWARSTPRLVQAPATELEQLGVRPARSLDSSG